MNVPRVLPPVTSASHSIAQVAQAWRPGTRVDEQAVTHPGQRAPAPITTQATDAAALQRVSSPRPIEEGVEMTLEQFALFVEKAKRGVRSIVTGDIDEAADWDPSTSRPVAMERGRGADLVRRMLGK